MKLFVITPSSVNQFWQFFHRWKQQWIYLQDRYTNFEHRFTASMTAHTISIFSELKMFAFGPFPGAKISSPSTALSTALCWTLCQMSAPDMKEIISGATRDGCNPKKFTSATHNAPAYQMSRKSINRRRRYCNINMSSLGAVRHTGFDTMSIFKSPRPRQTHRVPGTKFK